MEVHGAVVKAQLMVVEVQVAVEETQLTMEGSHAAVEEAQLAMERARVALVEVQVAVEAAQLVQIVHTIPILGLEIQLVDGMVDLAVTACHPCSSIIEDHGLSPHHQPESIST